MLLYMKSSAVCRIQFGPEIMIHTYVGHVDCLRHSVDFYIVHYSVTTNPVMDAIFPWEPTCSRTRVLLGFQESLSGVQFIMLD